MRAHHIFTALQDVPDGPDADDAARAGFLEWALSLPSGVAAQAAACDALSDMENAGNVGAAARKFLGFLKEAAVMRPGLPIRRGGRLAHRAARH